MFKKNLKIFAAAFTLATVLNFAFVKISLAATVAQNGSAPPAVYYSTVYKTGLSVPVNAGSYTLRVWSLGSARTDCGLYQNSTPLGVNHAAFSSGANDLTFTLGASGTLTTISCGDAYSNNTVGSNSVGVIDDLLFVLFDSGGEVVPTYYLFPFYSPPVFDTLTPATVGGVFTVTDGTVSVARVYLDGEVVKTCTYAAPAYSTGDTCAVGGLQVTPFGDHTAMLSVSPDGGITWHDSESVLFTVLAASTTQPVVNLAVVPAPVGGVYFSPNDDVHLVLRAKATWGISSISLLTTSSSTATSPVSSLELACSPSLPTNDTVCTSDDFQLSPAADYGFLATVTDSRGVSVSGSVGASSALAQSGGVNAVWDAAIAANAPPDCSLLTSLDWGACVGSFVGWLFVPTLDGLRTAWDAIFNDPATGLITAAKQRLPLGLLFGMQEAVLPMVSGGTCPVASSPVPVSLSIDSMKENINAGWLISSMRGSMTDDTWLVKILAFTPWVVLPLVLVGMVLLIFGFRLPAALNPSGRMPDLADPMDGGDDEDDYDD